jgi:hypothetical protein
VEKGSAAYHRAAATRARRLREEATTPPLKEQLADTIAQHEQIAEEIERATEVRPSKEPAEDETASCQAKPPGDLSGGSADPAWGRPDVRSKRG